jgi:hypothetical protein
MTTSDRISWISHQGKQIVLEDYSGLQGKDMLDVLYASEKFFERLQRPVPVLLDFTDSFVGNDFMNEFTRLRNKYDTLIKKGASIGFNGSKKALAMVFFVYTGQDHKSKICDSKQEALDYLTATEKTGMAKSVS